MSDLVSISTREGVADVRLNRPEKYNALSPSMFAEIAEAGAALAEDSSVRAVVLSGNGRGFCAGLDFASFQAMAGKESGESKRSGGNGVASPRLSRPANLAQNAAYVWKTLPVPVIAALHGSAYGGGFQIAMGADLRIARPDTKLSVFEIKWGLIPDMAITQTAHGVVSLDILKELTFTGRIVEGREAQDLGLVTRLSENPLDDALALAAEIATKSPEAIRAGKKLFAEAWGATAEDSLPLEARLQAELIGSSNQVEAVRANMENRVPAFSDPD